RMWIEWHPLAELETPEQYELVEALSNSGAIGLTPFELGAETGIENVSEVVQQIRGLSPRWQWVLIAPDEEITGDRREKNYRIRWVPMTIIDALFESQSGFSTTGASVLSELEDPYLVPHCLLFWRSSTHFLGGLGIIVLFVAVLGQGSAGKALMRAEMPGPTKEGSTERMQHTAWRFVHIYCGLTVVLAAVLALCGMSVFDALCHSFGTMATGGFSTYNASLGAFANGFGQELGATVEYIVMIFMMIAGSNFTLLYLTAIGQPFRLAGDTEWRTYLLFIGGFSTVIVCFGLFANDFGDFGSALRYGMFTVVSVITTTGFVTADYDAWNNFGRGAVLLLMFVGGCAGSTGGGMKVIRHVLFLKILWLEVERSFHPSVVRLLRLAGKPVEDQDLRRNVLVFFGLIFLIFAFSWLTIITLESESTWGGSADHKLVDSASAVAATLNNVGPGLGTVGPTRNFGHFGPISKLLFVWLMMLGRLEIFPILVLGIPRFWKDR
ncbi:MAG: TrkH family potassium uptake protein, partial [Pirellulaceae bacterium]